MHPSKPKWVDYIKKIDDRCFYIQSNCLNLYYFKARCLTKGVDVLSSNHKKHKEYSIKTFLRWVKN